MSRRHWVETVEDRMVLFGFYYCFGSTRARSVPHRGLTANGLLVLRRELLLKRGPRRARRNLYPTRPTVEAVQTPLASRRSGYPEGDRDLEVANRTYATSQTTQ